MKLRYRNTRRDIVRGNLRVIRFNRSLMWYLFIVVSITLGLTIRDFAMQGMSAGLIVVAVILQLIGTWIVISIGMVVVTLLGLHFSKGKGVLGEHELTLSDDGLMEKTEYNESLHRWKGVGRVRESSAYYFVRVTESGGAYHVVPKKGQILEGDPDAFVAEIRRRSGNST